MFTRRRKNLSDWPGISALSRELCRDGSRAVVILTVIPFEPNVTEPTHYLQMSALRLADAEHPLFLVDIRGKKGMEELAFRLPNFHEQTLQVLDRICSKEAAEIKRQHALRGIK